MPFLAPASKQWLVQRDQVTQALSPAAQRVFGDAAQAILASGPTGTLTDAVKAYVAEHMPYLDAGAAEYSVLAIMVMMQATDASSDDLQAISSQEQEKLQEEMQEKTKMRDELSSLLKHAEDTNAAIAANVKD